MLSEEPEEQLPKENGQKAMDRADRRLSRRERESRLLVKRSEDYDVFDNVFDVPTLMIINDLKDDGVIHQIRGSLAAGKESKVYTAIAPDSTLLILKIYLTVSAEFRKRLQYIAGDPRFSDIKPGSRSLIAAWARKEFKNMHAARAAGVRVPRPIAVKKNVLVMEFVGDSEGNAVRPLIESKVTSGDYRQVIEQVTILYQKARLVHADLSEYNIFKTESGIMLFDFGSAVDVQHPNSKQFLVRDVMNINRFFEKRGIEVLDAAQAVEKIKGEKVKQQIEKRCGVEIEIDSESGNARISGNKPVEQMEAFRAIEVISAISRGFSPERASRLFEDEEIMFHQMDLHDYAGKSPNALERIKGRIIGEGGKARRTIEELSGAYVSVYGHMVGFIGNFKEVKLATDAIVMLAKGNMHKSVYKMLQDARRRDKMDRMRLWENTYDEEGVKSSES